MSRRLKLNLLLSLCITLGLLFYWQFNFSTKPLTVESKPSPSPAASNPNIKPLPISSSSPESNLTPKFSTDSSTCHAVQVNPSDPEAFLPDPNCTKGVTNPAVTQDNLSQTICQSGYTATIRPPANYTNKLKLKQIADYGYTDPNPKLYEEDHFISLELGGDPTNPQNLWPEPGPSSNEKDRVENYLHKQVCTGNITLKAAQDLITTNWYSVYQTLSPQ